MSCKVRLSRRISSATAMRCEYTNLFILVGLTTGACTEMHFVGFLESMAPTRRSPAQRRHTGHLGR